MGNKALSAYFFTIEKMEGVETTLLSRSELELALKAISELELDRSKELGRYYSNGIDERCMMFMTDMVEIPQPPKSAYVPGLFIKRRTSNYPYENDDKGKLYQIQLSSENNELAEVTFFIIDTSLRVLMYVSNPYVGSSSSLVAYFNDRLHKYNENIEPLSFFADESFIGLEFPPIINNSPETEFDSMVNISTLEIFVAGSLNTLESLLSSKNDDSASALEKAVGFAKKARSKSMRFALSSARMKDKLDKSEIKKIYKQMLSFFRQSDQNNKFVVKGRIDDEVRYLDLLNADYFHRTSFDYDGRYVPIHEVFKRLYPIMDKYHDVFIKKCGFEEKK